MFIIGLELRPQRLWDMRKPIFVLGSLQVGITGVLLAVLAFCLTARHCCKRGNWFCISAVLHRICAANAARKATTQ